MKNEPITRRQAISACVEKYIKNNPEEWMQFKNQVKEKRKLLADTRFGVVKDDLKSWNSGAAINVMRQTIMLPNTLAHAISMIMRTHDNQEPFPEDDTEEGWFVKNYPDFLIPENY